MARWYPWHERDPGRTKDPRKQAKIYQARLIREIGGEPTTSQLMLIRSLVPLFMEAERLRDIHERSGFMNKRYPGLQAQISNTMGQLMNSVGSGKGKKKQADAPEAEKEEGLDLGAVLNVQDS